MLSTPIPAETFMHSTTQMHQKAAVLWASLRCTWPWVIIAFTFGAGRVHPAGCQSGAGTR